MVLQKERKQGTAGDGLPMGRVTAVVTGKKPKTWKGLNGRKEEIREEKKKKEE